MLQQDLYVHVSAPSLVSDDRRWMSVAEAVVNFKPNRRVYVMDQEPINMPRQAHQPLRESLRDRYRISKPRSSHWTEMNPAYKKPTKASTGQENQLNRKRVLDTVQTSMTNNPKRRRFMRDTEGSSVTSTPSRTEARVSPEIVTLVPRTNSLKRRTRTTAVDGTGLRERGIDETSFDFDDHQADVRTAADEEPAPSNDEDGEEDDGLPMHQITVAEPGLAASPTEYTRGSIYSSFPTNQVDANLTGPILEIVNGRESSLVPTADFDAHAAQSILSKIREQEDATSDISTPSTPSPQKASEPRMHVCCGSTVRLQVMEISQSAAMGSVSPIVHTESTDQQIIVSPETILKRIHRLSADFDSPSQAWNHAKDRLAVEDDLVELAQQFDLSNSFRPCEVSRRALPDERGHWRLELMVASATRVAALRRKPATSSQLEDCRRSRRLQRSSAFIKDQEVLVGGLKGPELTAIWTIGEFEHFWATLQKTVTRGRAGYFVWGKINQSQRHQDMVQVQARIYSYCNKLTHLWLLMLGLSDGRIKHLPMQWYGECSDCIIKMPVGTEQGNPLLWVLGRDGSWGHHSPRSAV